MSDIEDYESEYSSDSELSDDEIKPINNINKGVNQKVLDIDDILGKDSDSEIDEDEESIDEQVDDEDDDVQYGGADDELEEGEIEENDNDNVEIKKNGNENKKQKIIKSIPVNIDEDDENDEDDDDDYDENYLQKFDRDINKNYIEEFHPECILQNHDEISLLTRVVRDNNNIIIDPLHKTIPFLTKYEKAKIIGQRAKQIEFGAKPFIKVPENIIDSYVIAELELQQKIIPFIIRRPLPGGGCEFWNLKDLEIISF
jgi:DNA-directed RNA polymerase subunit K/omega